MEEKIQLLNQILEDAETYGSYEVESSGDSIEDLNEEEIDILYDQLVQKLKRPRHGIGTI